MMPISLLAGTVNDRHDLLNGSSIIHFYTERHHLHPKSNYLLFPIVATSVDRHSDRDMCAACKISK